MLTPRPQKPLKYSNTTCYNFFSGVYYTLNDMFRPFYNGHLQASILGSVVNIIVTSNNIRDLVSRSKIALYYHILVGGIVRVVNYFTS
jgi:hypothetical protein